MPKNDELKPDAFIHLWKSAESGDRSALAQLLRGLQDLIYRFCMSQLRDENAAIEATQETAVRLIENLKKFSGNGKLTTWVLGIANNVCREMRRKQSKLQTLETGAADIAEEPSVESTESNDSLKHAIEQLPDRQREAIVLRYYESLSLVEVAEVMQVSIGTVKATINQALKKLKLKLPENE